VGTVVPAAEKTRKPEREWEDEKGREGEAPAEPHCLSLQVSLPNLYIHFGKDTGGVLCNESSVVVEVTDG